MLIKQMTVGSMAVCCYLVACEQTRQGVIIDPGGNEEEVVAACRQEDITVQYIINTHAHPDHVCGNGAIKAATGAAIVMHRADADFFARPEVQNYFSMLALPASPPPDKLVQDGDTLTFGELSLQVLHTPGHTPGGICLYNASHLFTGDTLFVGGVGRTDFPGGDTQELLHSIQAKLLALPPETVVWPGHGYGGARSTIAEEKRSNPFLAGGW